MKKSGKIQVGGRGGGGAGAGRQLHTRVKKKAGTIKASSRHWLERQLNDPYVAQAKRDGYRSRAAYKLLEIHERTPILRKGSRVIDLGCAPGGWCQVAAAIVGENLDNPLVVGIDYLPVDPLAGVHLLEMDFLQDEAPQKLMEALGGAPDVVLSDMAAPTTGIDARIICAPPIFVKWRRILPFQSSSQADIFWRKAFKAEQKTRCWQA